MPISVSRLRRVFAGSAIFVCVVVLGAFLYKKHRAQNALKQVPEKMGIQVQQSAQEFTISKSDQGRTLFKLQASKAVQFKQGGRAELHDVTITIYGRDASRFDQVYGHDFEYDPQSGDVTSNGEVSIDLQANPQGILHPDQAPPKELKNPFHLKTTGLVFNQKTGDAWTKDQVDFRMPQAGGSAVGARYVAQDGVLTLESQIRITVNGDTPSTLTAERATLQKAPRQIVLHGVRAQSVTQRAQADEVTLFLRDDNKLDRTLASGKVRLESTGQAASQITGEELEVQMADGNAVRNGRLSGNVHLLSEGPQAMEAKAGRAELQFASRNVLTKIHAGQGVTLTQKKKPGEKSAQDIQVSAPAMEFLVTNGKHLRQAETIGTPLILLAGNDAHGETRITAEKFTAKFDAAGQLSQVHGEPNARVVSMPPQNETSPELTSTSDSIDAYFRPGTGIEAVLQKGRFAYKSGSQQAFADFARYTPADGHLALGGSPRVLDTGMQTAAGAIQLVRETSDALATGGVKTTYSDLKAQAGGALLAASDPIHITAQQMIAHKPPETATYTGGVRLWQNANVIAAPFIQFQKDQRVVTAEARGSQKVSTVLVGTDKNGKAAPVTVTSDRLTYRDADRKAHFEGGVTVRGADLTISSSQMEVFLEPSAISRQPSDNSPTPNGLSKLEKIVASGSVLITEPKRRATGDQLTYTASDDKFVLTGGPPSIFDAEHGKITGVSLTLFRRDDRFVVEGDSSSPAVTQTRVVR